MSLLIRSLLRLENVNFSSKWTLNSLCSWFHFLALIEFFLPIYHYKSLSLPRTIASCIHHFQLEKIYKKKKNLDLRVHQIFSHKSCGTVTPPSNSTNTTHRPSPIGKKETNCRENMGSEKNEVPTKLPS